MNEETENGNIASLVPVAGEKNAFDELSDRLNLIRRLMREKMVKDVDYGIIPGCDKPSLWQPGAEKIGVLFGVSVEPGEIEDLSNGDEVRFRCKQIARDKESNFLGSVLAECSSFEKKYRWRKAVCDQEWEEALETRRREKWNKGWNNKPASKVKQILCDPEDSRNTIILMCQKRGFVAVMRRVTGASEIFTQDGEHGEDGSGNERPDIKKPQQKNKSNAKNGTITEEQTQALNSTIADFDLPPLEVQEILTFFDVQSIPGIPSSKYVQITKAIAQKGKERAATKA